MVPSLMMSRYVEMLCFLRIYTRRAGWVGRFFGNDEHNAYTWHIDEDKVSFATVVDVKQRFITQPILTYSPQ
jgi:hypothetical protein